MRSAVNFLPVTPRLLSVGPSSSSPVLVLLLFFVVFVASPTVAAMTSVASVASSSSPPPRVPPRLVLLDRDGVINHDVGAPGVLSPDQLVLTPGAAEAVRALRDRDRSDAAVAVVTNQSCVGKGLATRRELDGVHSALIETLSRDVVNNNDDDDDYDDDHEQRRRRVFDRIYVCESVSNDDPRKKPNPGMVEEALRDFGVTNAARDACFVGDTLKDMRAAARAGVRWRILVSTGYGSGVAERAFPRAEEERRRRERREGEPLFVHKVETMEGEDDDDDDCCPFWYTDNLSTAVEWLLSSEKHDDGDEDGSSD